MLMRSRTAGFVFAVVVVALAALVRFALRGGSIDYGLTNVTFSPAVMLVAMLAGFWPGMLATTLASIVAAYWFLPAVASLHQSLTDTISQSAFVLTGVLMSAAAHFYHRSREKMADSQRERAEDLQRLRLHVENSPMAVVEWDKDAVITRWGGAAEILFGWSAAETVGKRMDQFALIYPADLPIVTQTMARLTDGTTSQAVSSSRNYTKDGGIRHCLWYCSALLDTSGQMQSVMSLILDVTDRVEIEEALRESEERFRAAFEQGAIGMTMSSLDGKLLQANTAFCHMLGYTAPELVGRSFLEITHPDHLEANIAALQQIADGQIASYRLEKPYIRRDGQRVWGDLNTVAVPDAAGNPSYLVSHVVDITERKQAEEARETMLAVLGILNNHDDLPTMISTLCTFFQQWSECEAVGIRQREGDDFPYCEVRGFPAEFVQAENSLCVRLPDGQCARDAAGNPQLECMCGNILRGRYDPSQPFFTYFGSFWTNSTSELLAGTSEADRQARTRNRCHGEGYESVALIPLRLGEETFGLLQMNDHRAGRFTPERIALAEWLCQHIAIALIHRQTEQNLRRERAFLEAAIDMLPLPITFINHDGEEILGNRAARARLPQWGFGAHGEAQLLDPRTRALIPADHWPSLRALRGETVIGEEMMLHVPATGEEVPCLCYAAPVVVDGRIIASGVLLEDITALKEADRAKDEFLAVLSHELQTPLTSMLGWSAEALRVGTPEMMAQAMEVVHRNAVRQKYLVAEILEMSRLLHRKVSLLPEATDLWTQAHHAVENMAHVLANRDVRLLLGPPGDPLPIRVDPVRLQQCIGNLLNNSLKFTPDGGMITVSCRRDDDRAVLRVRDTGRGIDPAALPAVFQAFRQVDRDERAGGLGLGLAITRGIVELHGGQIVADSAGKGLGSTFTITLPIDTGG